MVANNPAFNAPIPGQSLTMHPGSMPMEKPPQFVDPRQAAEFFWTKLNQPKNIIKVVVMLRKGVPCEYLTRAFLYEAIIQGIVSIDCAYLIARVVLKQIAAIGHLKGVPNMKIKNPDQDMINFANTHSEHMYDLPPPQPPSGAAPTKTPITKGLLANG